MSSPRRLDPKSLAEGRRQEREQIARNLNRLAENGLAMTPNDRRVIAMIAQSVWAGTLSKRPPTEAEGRSPSPWTPKLDQAATAAS